MACHCNIPGKFLLERLWWEWDLSPGSRTERAGFHAPRENDSTPPSLFPHIQAGRRAHTTGCCDHGITRGMHLAQNLTWSEHSMHYSIITTTTSTVTTTALTKATPLSQQHNWASGSMFGPACYLLGHMSYCRKIFAQKKPSGKSYLSKYSPCKLLVNSHLITCSHSLIT